MDEVQKLLHAKFASDVINIATTLIAKFKLCHTTAIPQLSTPLLRWLDFRLRFIEPKPRKVALSCKFPMSLPADVREAADHFFTLVEAGKDINPYQGKGLIDNHDTSGKRRERRTDLLWADWNILHFHLTTENVSENHYFSKRSDWLIFGMLDNEIFACIDIRPHYEKNVFSNTELMHIVAKSWPKFMEQYELKGIHSSEGALTAEEYADTRKGGLTCPLTISGNVYMGPGLGITTASTAARVTDAEFALWRYLSKLVEILCDATDDVLPGWKSSGPTTLTLCVTPAGLAIYDQVQDTAWVLPKDASFLSSLQALLAPEWVVDRLF